MLRRRIVFSGRVQGVGFRATAQWLARGRAVSGWVRNQEDGSVLLEVQGEAAAVEGYLGAIRAELGCHITREQGVDARAVDGERGFEIRR